MINSGLLQFHLNQFNSHELVAHFQHCTPVIRTERSLANEMPGFTVMMIHYLCNHYDVLRGVCVWLRLLSIVRCITHIYLLLFSIVTRPSAAGPVLCESYAECSPCAFHTGFFANSTRFPIAIKSSVCFAFL